MLDDLGSNCEPSVKLGRRPNSRPISLAPMFRKAQSKPLFEVDHKVQLAGRLKKIKPQHKADFSNGRILRWDDYAATRRVPNQKQKRDCALSVNEKAIDKGKSLATTALR